ncbi:hypothetical protein ZHAS_00013528 [Anopheles sinensis]|uniref:Uncharacterized protein n=1 Tax=Anopheles sinensis TaxID=74873 RepID=A0A084W5R9_ANOSI|nr:hypothetical protein ZHAS_00013528 [Anopheles sinensis]
MSPPATTPPPPATPNSGSIVPAPSSAASASMSVAVQRDAGGVCADDGGLQTTFAPGSTSAATSSSKSSIVRRVPWGQLGKLRGLVGLSGAPRSRLLSFLVLGLALVTLLLPATAARGGDSFMDGSSDRNSTAMFPGSLLELTNERSVRALPGRVAAGERKSKTTGKERERLKWKAKKNWLKVNGK